MLGFKKFSFYLNRLQASIQFIAIIPVKRLYRLVLSPFFKARFLFKAFNEFNPKILSGFFSQIYIDDHPEITISNL
jgi:hypothetical protein